MRSTWVNAALSATLVTTLAALGCSGAEDDDDGVQTFQPPGAAAPGTPASGTPAQAAPGSSNTPGVTPPAPGAEAPPPVAGIDTGSGGRATNGSAAPTPAAPAPTPPADPNVPATPAPGVSGATASAGCGLAQGVPQSPITIDDPNTIVTFPVGYDGTTPFPLLFAFHGANRTNLQMRTEDSRTPGSAIENNYVVAYVGSQGTAWDLGTDYPRFGRVLDRILDERCIDTSALFAMGHSSGAQFIAQMLGDNRARETRLAAVAPVSSSLFNNPQWDPLPTLLIHGQMDTARPDDLDGTDDISQYARSNQCSGATQPVDVGTCSSIAGGVSVDPGCVQYDGCAATTLFCRHDDPNYLQNGTPTNHGWPCFANQQIFDFFESVR